MIPPGSLKSSEGNHTGIVTPSTDRNLHGEFGVHTVPLCVLRKQKGGDHWNSIINGFGVGKIKRSHLLPPQVATPQTAAATIAMKPLLTWVSLLKFQKL